MAKAPDAFRTISEVSEWLDTPAHVLRFWESKFTQVKPVKRAGGRRYYRPDDMALLAGIKILLHEQGMTIKGAQKLLREKGVKHVAAMSPPLDGADADDTSVVIDAAPLETKSAAVADTPRPVPAEEVLAEPVEQPPLPEPEDEAETVIPFAPTMPPPTQRPAAVASAPDEAMEEDGAEDMDEPSVPSVADNHDRITPGPRLIGLLQDVDPDTIRSRAAQIAPYAVRLRTLRDRMRGH